MRSASRAAETCFAILDREAGARDQDQGEDPLHQVDRAADQEDGGAGSKIDDQGYQVGESGAEERRNRAAQEGIGGRIAKKRLVDAGRPEGKKGHDNQDRRGTEHEDDPLRGDGDLIESDGKEQADADGDRVRHQPEEFFVLDGEHLPRLLGMKRKKARLRRAAHIVRHRIRGCFRHIRAPANHCEPVMCLPDSCVFPAV